MFRALFGVTVNQNCIINKMKLAILAAFLFVAAVAALPVVEQPKGEAVAVEASPEQAQDKQGADDLKTEETFWGGWGGRYYGGWGGGYYAPSYYGGGWGEYGYPSLSWVRTYWY